jgi:hypothetical protein
LTSFYALPKVLFIVGSKAFDISSPHIVEEHIVEENKKS